MNKANKDKGIFEQHQEQEAANKNESECCNNETSCEHKQSEEERPDSEVFTSEQEEISRLNDELTKTKESLLRTLADGENLKRRTEKEVSDAHKFASKNFATDMLEVYENFDRAMQNIDQKDLKENDKLKSLHEGMSLTMKTLETAFKKNGVERVSPAPNEEFNHDIHQALQQLPAEGVENGNIAFTVQAGYILNGRLLRPALVNIAKN